MPATMIERRWMQGSSSPLRGALLGLVLERPGHGGELASRLARRLGEAWRVDPTDIYRLLGRLEAEMLVCSREEHTAGNRHGAVHLVYHPTDRSAAALTLWLETLLPREPLRTAIHAKLAAARGQEDGRLLVRALEAHERECLEMAKLLPPMTGTSGSWKNLFLDCLRGGVWAQLQVEIDWARQTRQRIIEFSARR